LGIFGHADDTISLESSALLADQIPRARVEIISGGAHHLNIHRRSAVHDLMLSFLHNNGAIPLPAESPTE
jgi:pimeloyl-ACP methyl ester carboxylesterase